MQPTMLATKPNHQITSLWNNNNNNNTNNNIHSAFISTKVQPVHVMNVACGHRTVNQATDLPQAATVFTINIFAITVQLKNL